MAGLTHTLQVNGLDLILSKTSHLLVLRELFHAEEAITGREVQRRTGLSNRATMLALEALVACSVVRCETTPQANWYEVNRNNYFYVKAVKIAFEAEDLFWNDLSKLIRRVVRPRPIAAVATGPLARDAKAVTSRLELTLVFNSGRNRVRAFRCLDDLVDSAWERFAVNVDVNWLDAHSVDNEEFSPLWRRVEREGVLLYGTLP